jgi:hypothetical protein
MRDLFTNAASSMEEHNLAKVGVVGSNPIARSKICQYFNDFDRQLDAGSPLLTGFPSIAPADLRRPGGRLVIVRKAFEFSQLAEQYIFQLLRRRTHSAISDIPAELLLGCIDLFAHFSFPLGINRKSLITTCVRIGRTFCRHVSESVR